MKSSQRFLKGKKGEAFLLSCETMKPIKHVYMCDNKRFTNPTNY